MNYTTEEVLRYIEEEDVKFIRLAFRDAFGIQKNVSVTPNEIATAFEDGIAINAQGIAGCAGSKLSNLLLKPDPSTLSILPWRPDNGKVVRLLCDMYRPDGTPFEGDTRWILKQAVEYARKAGCKFRFGSESEFYLFKKDDQGNPTKEPYDEAGYLDIAPLDRGENIRREICLTIEKMGLTPERSHHERGPGQNEIDFHYGNPLKAADHMTTFQMAVSTIADRNGLYADFSPMPLANCPGNGYHINMYVKDMEDKDLGRYAAAGVLDKIRDMTLFLNPSEGSYARFGTGTAPDRINWSTDGTSELVYLSNDKDITRTELRSPDALSNPYLTYALLIYAGVEGVRNKMELPKETEEDGIFLPHSIKDARKFALESPFIKEYVLFDSKRAKEK